MSNDFEWDGEDYVEIPPQRRTAIYQNTDGNVVVRQVAAWDEDSDPFMVFTSNRENMARLIYAMIDAADLPWQIIENTGRGFIDVDNPNLSRQHEGEADKPRSKDPTAAERQRRRREKLRQEAEPEAPQKEGSDRDSGLFSEGGEQ